MHVFGRADGDGEESAGARPAGEFGRFLAPDGSLGGRVGVDFDGPHVVSVVGKRGSGKSYTLGVLAEELDQAEGVTGVVVDPMGVFATLAEDGARVIDRPRVPANALPPQAWCDLLGLDPAGGPGALLWQAASNAGRSAAERASVHESERSRAADRNAARSGNDEAANEPSTLEDRSTLAEMCAFVEGADAPVEVRRAVSNHLALAREWECFGEGSVDVETLLAPDVTVLDCSGLAGPALDAVVSAVAAALYRRAVDGGLPRLPWLLVDEAHVPFGGVGGDALETLLTRGRQPGVSLALATQRPRALPEVALSQTDLLVAHRLTTEADISALATVHPTYLRGEFRERLPSEAGEALVVDDRAAGAQTIRVRERETRHGGASPRAGEVAAASTPATDL